MGLLTRNTREVNCLGMNSDMTREKTVQQQLEGLVFFVFKETQEVRSCIVFFPFFFFNEERSAVGVVLQSRTHLLTYDWLSAVWSHANQPVALVVHLSKARPSQTLQQVH